MAVKKKEGSGLLGLIIIFVILYLLFGSTSSSLASYQSCVMNAESGGNAQIWNEQGQPYWGLYQFSESLWTGAGGQSASTWGNAPASVQTQAFDNVMSNPDGCENWYPSDGCTYPEGGCG